MKNSALSLSEILVENQREIFSLNENLRKAALHEQKSIDALLCDVLVILDTFQRAETAITEHGWDGTDEAAKAIKRLLQAKKRTVALLDKYQVKATAAVGEIARDEDCQTVDTEPAADKADGTIISIERQGYRTQERILRPAEVVVVKN